MSFIVPPDRSTSSSSPSSIKSETSPLVMTGSPIFIAFLKNMRANDSAITALMPLAFIASGACSLEEPHPKLLPATIIFFLSLSLQNHYPDLQNNAGQVHFRL